MAFLLAMTLPLDKDVGFGLLCVSCVPGGGFGHVAVVIADGDAALSVTMNLISAVAMLGMFAQQMSLLCYTHASVFIQQMLQLSCYTRVCVYPTNVATVMLYMCLCFAC